MHRTRIKICGCADEEDVRIASEAGADLLGFIFAESPRRLDPKRAAEIARTVPDHVEIVGVVVNPSFDDLFEIRTLMPRIKFQFHGTEPSSFTENAMKGTEYLKAFHIRDDEQYAWDDFRELLDAYRHALPLFDTAVDGRSGGTGVKFGWEALRQMPHGRFVVAGGLSPENVGGCVSLLHPFGVDVRSGVETNGKKDPQKVRAFIEAVRAADASA